MNNNDKFRLMPFEEYKGVRTEIFSNRKASVEGCTGILKYDSSMIKLRTKKMILCFSGRSLTLSCMDKDSVVVEGFITNIEYIV